MTVSAIARSGISLGAILVLVTAGYAQTPCKSVDEEAPGASRAAPNVEAFRTASPEAITAFQEQAARATSRIIGGVQTSIANNPWQVALIRSVVAEPTRSQFCGGSLIRNNWVLTAAHCVRNQIVLEKPERVDVIVGSSQYAIGGQRLKVAAVHVHPNYNRDTNDSDFALLRLQSSATMGQPIQTADANTQVNPGTDMCVTGWGATFEGGPGAINLLGAQIPIVSNEECNKPDSYNGEVTATMMCAGKRAGGLDSCQGDSGGPGSVMIGGRPTLVGVVSFGEGCARRLKYGIYSRVPAAAAWIASTIQ